MINLIKLIVSIIRIVISLLPALRLLPTPSISQLRQVGKLIWPWVRKVDFSKGLDSKVVDTVRKVEAFVCRNKELLIKLAQTTKSVVLFVISLIKLLTSRLTKTVVAVVATVSNSVKRVWSFLNTKLW